MINKFRPKDKAEWLELRRHYIGGSDAGSVMGMNPYAGPFTVWSEKTGRTEGFGGNITTETGTYLEPFVAQLFERETGKKVRRDNFTMVNDLYPWACADVDRRIVGDNALLECKTTTSMPNIRKFNAGEYPEQWYCQMTHYLAVTGCERIYLAVLINCCEFRYFVLERDQAEIDALMSAEKDFWQHVESDTPPAAAGSDSDAVYEVYAVSDPELPEMDLSADADLLERYEAAALEAKEAAERRDAIKADICRILGDHERGSAEGFRVKWTSVNSQRFDAKAFKAARPDIDLTPYYKTSTSRRFDLARLEK